MGLADDIIYVSLLVISIGFGPFLRRVKDPFTRKIASGLAGLLIGLVVSGWHILHPIIMISINGLIITFASMRNCHIISFAFCFGYLAFFRTCNYFGLPAPPAHTNAIVMILALKLVGLAFEVRDTYYRKKDQSANALEVKFQDVHPSILDMFCYGLCHAGVLTGPYYKFRTFWDCFHGPHNANVDMYHFFLQRIKVVPIYAILFLISGYIFPIDYTESEEILERSILYRFFYLTPVFFTFRMRLYTAFVLSECQCLTFGLGYYPVECKSRPGQGPTELEPLNQTGKKYEYNYETIHNIDEYGSEFVTTFREGMRCWNMTIQYWLAIFVYKRVTMKKFRVAITMLTSSYWHGVYASYYQSLLTVPFMLMAEGVMDKALRRNASPSGQKTYDWICWFLKMQAFAYIGIAFYPVSFSYWRNMYFIGHIIIVLFYALGLLIIKLQRKQRKSTETVVDHSKSD